MAKDYPCVKVMKLSDLCAVSDETRTVSTEALFQLKKQYELLGVIQFPIFNVKTKRLLGGKLGVQVLRDSGELECQVVCVDLPVELENTAIMALNNHAGEWVWQPVSEQLKEMQERKQSLQLTGFRDYETSPLVSADWTKPEIKTEATEREMLLNL